MKISLMQKVDYWLGVPLCAPLSVWNAITSRLFPRKPTSPRYILFIELSEMGSAILAYASLVNVQKLFPDATVYFLIFTRNKESVELLNLIPRERILLIEDRSFIRF